MSAAVLVVNAGSSSIKFARFPLAGDGRSLAAGADLTGQVAGIGSAPRFTAGDAAGNPLLDEAVPSAAKDAHRVALDRLMAWLEARDDGADIVAIGHRVVHGGEHHSAPLRIDAATLAALAEFVPLAPLHQPHNLDAIRICAELRPRALQVACFDTAFHRQQPPLAQLFALPRSLTESGVRRYGFHGLSYEFIAQTLPQHVGRERADGRVVVAHLGAGASMCAMHRRRSMATTMGFTALDGLMMATRCGNIDPGVLLYLMQRRGYDAAALDHLLNHESGLLGVSGLSADMRSLLASDREEAKQAVDLFCYRVGRELGSLAAALGGLDVLVFTGGIGEHAAPVRERICRDAAWLGLEFDASANAAGAVTISSPASRVVAVVLPTNEEQIIAQHVVRLLSGDGSADLQEQTGYRA